MLSFNVEALIITERQAKRDNLAISNQNDSLSVDSKDDYILLCLSAI